MPASWCDSSACAPERMDPRRLRRSVVLALFVSVLVGGGCSGRKSTDETDAGDGGSSQRDGGGEADAGTDACPPEANDYVTGSAPDQDTWPACVSDDGQYHLVASPPSSAGRVDAFERIADLLFGQQATLSADAFTSARLMYVEDQGLDSRVQRREDEHYPPAENEQGEPAACQDEGIADLPHNRERCVGPALILPLLLDAFRSGMRGEDLEVNAARVEAGLLWFLYVSVYKEAVTCGTTPQDCDSSWAYYNGAATSPADGLGLASYVREGDVQADARTWAGHLALRCWRDLVDSEQVTNGAQRPPKGLASAGPSSRPGPGGGRRATHHRSGTS